MAIGELQRLVQRRYAPSDYPALFGQAQAWHDNKPLAGLRVLDATPVFTNTVTKYLALLAGGAEVVVSPHCGIPPDEAVLSLLPAADIAVWDGGDAAFDVVFDCAGTHRDVAAHLGYVELTRSGAARYATSGAPVFLADAGRIKRIETTLGTGDGWLRAMAHLGHDVPRDVVVVVVGAGKVGQGVALAAQRAGATVTVVDPVQPPGGPWRWLHPDDTGVVAALQGAWCVVAATGARAGLSRWAPELVAGQSLLANMGAEDEFGDEVPTARVLNGKIAVNFSLAEPTRLRYLDPTLAVSNAGAVALLAGDCAPGLNDPPRDLEDDILARVMANGLIGEEIAALGLLR